MKEIKVLSVAVVLAMLFTLASCSKENTDGTDTQDNREFTAGNTDYENTYYSTKMITLPVRSIGVSSFAIGDKAYFVTTGSWEYNEKAGKETSLNTLFVCDYDGQIEEQHELIVPDDFYVRDLCPLDDDSFITVSEGGRYVVFDFDGNVVKTDRFDTALPDCAVCVGKTSEGIIVGMGDKVARYDNGLNLIDEIPIEMGPYDLPEYSAQGVFEQGGKYYCYAYVQPDANSSVDYYCALDFETGTIEQLIRPWEIANGFMPDMVYGADYHRSTMGEQHGGNNIVEIDVANEKAEVLANKSNMLICPPTYDNDDEPFISVLDKTHYYIPYTYPGKDLGVTEIALIVPDETLDLGRRTPVTVQGAGVMNDKTLQNAAYYYNVSQDDYLIKFDDLSSRYTFSTPESMNMTKLQLMANYTSGEAPDIFYGNFFDYNYFGENGMALDLKPYLGNDHIYDDMVRADGKMYQVYTGYTVGGYFGLDDVYDINCDITSMPDIPEGQKRFGNSFSPDIVFNALGRDLCTLYRAGNLTHDNVLSVVREAIEEGCEPDYEYTNYVPPMPTDVRDGSASLFNYNISSPESYYSLMSEFGGTPVFVGYPSAGGSVHMIAPQSLMAVSSSTEHADVCCDFISSLMTPDSQRRICSSGMIPVDHDVLLEMIDTLKDPDHASDENKALYGRLTIHDYSADKAREIRLTDEMASRYLEIADQGDTIEVYDWGLWVITRDEVSTYYTQGKSIEEVADALYSRYLVYAKENY
ncbi:ABC-type glycerol-3-phosphate transport system, substrate-binding protein [Ruminococcaceae bacterium YRB3002]|nr:ABC-type glycerol-3-phosphate transport system, substrate-binding protein [Ruminococcaceae bacterium YRB3002]